MKSKSNLPHDITSTVLFSVFFSDLWDWGDTHCGHSPFSSLTYNWGKLGWRKTWKIVQKITLCKCLWEARNIEIFCKYLWEAREQVKTRGAAPAGKWNSSNSQSPSSEFSARRCLIKTFSRPPLHDWSSRRDESFAAIFHAKLTLPKQFESCAIFSKFAQSMTR